MAEVLRSYPLPAADPVDDAEYGFLVEDTTGAVQAFRVVNNTDDAFRFYVNDQTFIALPNSGPRRVILEDSFTAVLEDGRWRVPFDRLVCQRVFAIPRSGSPTILGVTTAVFNTDATSHDHPMPACDAGDLLLILFGGNTPNAHTAVSTTPPSEFTEILDNGACQFDDASDFRISIGVFAKSADGDEDGVNMDVVTNQAIAGSGHIYHIDAGTWSGDVTDIETAATETIIDGTADSPNLAPSLGSLDYLWLTCGITDNDGPIITGAPTNYTNLTTTEANSTEDSTFATARRFTTASSENPGAFTQSIAENAAALTIAVPPTLASTDTVSLYPTADGTDTDVVDEGDATTDLFASIDDDPASPSDSDWNNNTDDAGQAFYELTNVPSDFDEAESATITIRYRGQAF